VFEEDLAGHYLASPDGTIIDCDRVFQSILGFSSRREALAINMAELWAEKKAHDAFVKQLRLRKKLEQYESLRRRRDGVVVKVIESAAGEFDQRGDLKRIRGRLFDETAGRFAERARREAEESYCVLLKSFPEAAIVSDAQERIVFANPAAARLVGAENAEALYGCSLLQFLPGTNAVVQEERSGAPERGKIVRIDGGMVDIESAHRIIQFRGTICTLRLVRDITSTVRAEQALLEKDREIALHLAKLEKLKDALTTLLEHHDQEGQRQLAGVRATIENLVLAYLAQLKATPLESGQLALIEVMEANLRDITSSFTHELESWRTKLTPTELQIADLLRQGKRTKEIAGLLKVSRNAVTFHWNNIRAKLGLTRRPINLVSYLRTMAHAARPASGSPPRRARSRAAWA
jgi:PAS domain S-box-containing protein